jgi:hypothetical protein
MKKILLFSMIFVCILNTFSAYTVTAAVFSREVFCSSGDNSHKITLFGCVHNRGNIFVHRLLAKIQKEVFRLHSQNQPLILIEDAYAAEHKQLKNTTPSHVETEILGGLTQRLESWGYPPELVRSIENRILIRKSYDHFNPYNFPALDGNYSPNEINSGDGINLYKFTFTDLIKEIDNLKANANAIFSSIGKTDTCRDIEQTVQELYKVLFDTHGFDKKASILKSAIYLMLQDFKYFCRKDEKQLDDIKAKIDDFANQYPLHMTQESWEKEGPTLYAILTKFMRSHFKKPLNQVYRADCTEVYLLLDDLVTVLFDAVILNEILQHKGTRSLVVFAGDTHVTNVAALLPQLGFCRIDNDCLRCDDDDLFPEDKLILE